MKTELPTDLVVLGKFGRAHGKHGEIRLWAYNPESAVYEQDNIHGWALPPDGQDELEPVPIEITAVRWTDRFAIVKIAEIRFRDQAEPLCHREFALARELFPEVDEAEEFYLVDTLGWPVWLAQEDITSIVPIGTIADFIDTGANDVIRVDLGHGQSLLVPLLDHCILQFSPESGRLVLAPLESWGMKITKPPVALGPAEPFKG